MLILERSQWSQMLIHLVLTCITRLQSFQSWNMRRWSNTPTAGLTFLLKKRRIVRVRPLPAWRWSKVPLVFRLMVKLAGLALISKFLICLWTMIRSAKLRTTSTCITSTVLKSFSNLKCSKRASWASGLWKMKILKKKLKTPVRRSRNSSNLNTCMTRTTRRTRNFPKQEWLSVCWILIQ